MPRRPRLATCMMIGLLTLAGLALAVEPWTGFDAASSRATKLPADFNGMDFKGQPDASYGWMHLIHLKNGGWLTMLFSHSDVGPYAETSSIGLLYAHPDGTRHICRESWTGNEKYTRPPPGRYRLQIGNSMFGGRYPKFYVQLGEEECKGEIEFESIVPTFVQGSGLATFHSDRSGFWRLVTMSPRARSRGYVQFPGGRIDAAGDAYLELVANNVMIPEISDRWYILRSVQGDYTLNLFDIVLKKDRFGDAHIKTLMLARGTEILMGTTDFTYTPEDAVPDRNDVPVPARFKLEARDGETTLTGIVETGKTLDSMSLLSRMSPIFKLVAGFKYGKMWQYRTAARYDLELRQDGQTWQLQGVGFKEIHFYDQ